MNSNQEYCGNLKRFARLFQKDPCAVATVWGSGEYPGICGEVRFYRTRCGTLVAAEISGLREICRSTGNSVLAMHIHEGTCCCGNESDPFAQAGGHYNPKLCKHPNHAGDLPPLFVNGGYAFSIVLTDRFTVDHVIGRTVILHAGPDDFTSQPAGNAGEKIACGKIRNFCV